MAVNADRAIDRLVNKERKFAKALSEPESVEVSLHLFRKWLEFRHIEKEEAHELFANRLKGFRGAPAAYMKLQHELDQVSGSHLLDHARAFRTADKAVVLVSQPYTDPGTAEREAIEEYCQEHGMRVRFCSPSESWHYPEHTTLVEFWKAEEYPQSEK